MRRIIVSDGIHLEPDHPLDDGDFFVNVTDEEYAELEHLSKYVLRYLDRLIDLGRRAQREAN